MVVSNSSIDTQISALPLSRSSLRPAESGLTVVFRDSGGGRPALIQTLASLTCASIVSAALLLHAAQDAPPTKDDPIIGTWQLNVAKSTYVPGPDPISESRTYKRGANGVEGSIQRRSRTDGRNASIRGRVRPR